MTIRPYFVLLFLHFGQFLFDMAHFSPYHRPMTTPLPTPLSAGDTAWVFVASALVLLMVPGLALFYGGLVRTRAALNTFMMSLAALGVVSVQWTVVGYSLAFSPGGVIGGPSWFGFSGVAAAPGPYSTT